MRLAKPPSVGVRTDTRCCSRLCDASSGTGPASMPGLNVAVAVVTSDGLWSRFFGYASSSPLMLSEGADDAVTWASPAGATTTSFQPIRPAKVVSRNESDLGRSPALSWTVRRTASRRRVSRPPTPGGKAIACLTGVRLSLLPSTSSSSCRAIRRAVAAAYVPGEPIVCRSRNVGISAMSRT